MAKLIYSLDGAFLGEFPIDQERMTIGRRPTNDIHIDNLAISGEHASITTIGQDSFLEDCGSTNGTVVNGKPIKKHVLQHGDVIELGKYQLKYVSEASFQPTGGSAPVDYEKTMIIRPSAMHAVSPSPPPLTTHTDPEQGQGLPGLAKPPAASSAKPAPPAPGPAVKSTAPTPEESKPPIAHIQVLNGPSVGKELELSKALTTLGKPGVQVAVITRRPHGYFITHVEGVRHPIVNGESVGAQAYALQDHDVIELAGVKMEFFFV